MIAGVLEREYERRKKERKIVYFLNDSGTCLMLIIFCAVQQTNKCIAKRIGTMNRETAEPVLIDLFEPLTELADPLPELVDPCWPVQKPF